jgi:hypothetical protein
MPENLAIPSVDIRAVVGYLSKEELTRSWRPDLTHARPQTHPPRCSRHRGAGSERLIFRGDVRLIACQCVCWVRLQMRAVL